MFLSSVDTVEELLSAYNFTADVFIEQDGSVTMSLHEIDIVENADNEQSAINKLACAILEYSEDYYNDFAYWARGARKAHIPFVFKALILNNTEKIGGLIKCRRGRI